MATWFRKFQTASCIKCPLNVLCSPYCLISGLKERLQPWNHLPMYCLLLNVTRISLSLSFFFIQRKSERMFQNQEVKLKYRIVMYQVREVTGEIWWKDLHQMQMRVFIQRVLSLHWSWLLPFWKMARRLQEIFFHCVRPFSLLIVDWHWYYRRWPLQETKRWGHHEVFL